MLMKEHKRSYWYKTKYEFNRNLKRKFNITYIDYIRMHIQQDFKCKICSNQLQTSRNKHLDHCHKTGKVRGILCMNCNTRLGWFENNRLIIEGYINEYK